MKPTPNPTEYRTGTGREDLAAGPRNVFCPHYQHCLSIAVRSRWEDWTCSGCALVALGKPPHASEYAHDRRKKD